MTYNEQWTKELQEASGKIVYTNALTSFLYELIQKHLPAETVGKLVADVKSEPEVVLFANGWVANYANHLSELLTNDKISRLEKAITKAFGEVVDRKAEATRPSFKTDEEQVKERTEDVGKILDTMVNSGQLDPKEAEEIRKEMVEFEKETVSVPTVITDNNQVDSPEIQTNDELTKDMLKIDKVQ